jgi:hypothetical protein
MIYNRYHKFKRLTRFGHGVNKIMLMFFYTLTPWYWSVATSKTKTKSKTNTMLHTGKHENILQKKN